MPPDPNLFSLARSKLHVSVGKDNSLHRWVLLKNSMIRSLPAITSTSQLEAQASCSSDYDEEDEAVTEEESDAFMFPDGGKLIDGPSEEVNTSEAAWLDSLLETLADDDDDYTDADVHVSVFPVDDEDDQLLSPSISPMSSSDDLPTTINMQYPVPYPSFHPPLIHSYSNFDSSLSSIPPPYDDPLPYYGLEDDVPPVPDAIEDTSDDESEDPPTPSVGQSTSSLTLVDPASIPLPGERSGLRHLIHPQVYTDTDDSYFYPLELDPIPFPDDRRHSYIYQEC